MSFKENFPVWSTEGTEPTENKINSLCFTVTDYKQDTDVDDTAMIQRAIDDAFEKGGGTVLFPPGRYMITSSNRIIYKSNVKLLGTKGAVVLDFTQRSEFSINNSSRYFLMSGFGSIEEAIPLTADVRIGETVLNLNTTTLKEGDLIVVKSSERWEELTSSIYAEVGEMVLIDNVMSTNSFRLNRGLYHNYTVANDAKIYKVNPIENVTIEGLTIIGQGRNPDPDKEADLGMGFTYGRNILVKDCEFINIDTYQLEFRSCYNTLVDNCIFEHGKYTYKDSNGNVASITSGYAGVGSTRGAVQYQVRVADACQYITIQNCIGEGSRHFFNTGHSNAMNDGTLANSRNFLFGINHNIKVINCRSRNTWHAGFSTHNDVQYLEFIECLSEGSDVAGFNPRANFIRIKDCKVILSKVGVSLTSDFRNVSIEGCEFLECTSGIQHLETSATAPDIDHRHLIIKDNIFKSTSCAIKLYTNSKVAQSGLVIVKDNIILDTNSAGADGVYRIRGLWNIEFIGNKSFNANNIIYNLESAKSVSIENDLGDIGTRAIIIGSSNVQKLRVVNSRYYNITTGLISSFSNVPDLFVDGLNIVAPTNTETVQTSLVAPRGTSTARPTVGLRQGYLYNDTTLNKLIVWNGTAWTDAMGTIV